MAPPEKNPITDLGKAAFSNINPTDIAKVVLTLDDAAASLLKSFGQGQAMADLLRGNMAEAVTEVRKLGGDIEEVLKIQKGAAESLGRNIALSDTTTKDLYATMRVTGLEVGNIVNGMADAGIGAGKAAGEMLKVVNIARESGVNAQAVSSKVIENMNALNKFNFAGGVEGLAKMAAQATSLRIDMNQTLQFAEKVFNPEGAIEVAAAMQRLGVSQSALLDPLKLMDLSQNDPAELQNQIAQMSKQFVQLGKDGRFEIMPGAKRQLREISSAMGISYDQITKMALGGADLDKKMKEITFPSATEDQKKMIANMAEMGAGGTYQIKTADNVTKDVSALTGPELEALEKMANTAPPTMEELAKQQLTATEAIASAINSLGDRTGLAVAASKVGGKVLSGAQAAGRGIAAIPSEGLSTKNLKNEIDKFTDAVGGSIEQYVTTGTISASLGTALGNFGNFISNEMIQSFENMKTQADIFASQVMGGSNSAGATRQSTGNVVPITSNNNIPTGNSSTNTSSNPQISNAKSTMDVNLTVKVESNSPNIDTKQMESILTNPAFMEKLTVSVKDGMAKMNPVKNE
jgi:hypothetical protein